MRDQDFFWDGVDAGKLLIQKCNSCGTLRNPPGPMCPHCQSLERSSVEASGRGEICAWIQSKHPSKPDDNPRLVILVELEEGVRMVSNLPNVAVDHVHQGMKVELCFADVDGQKLPQFRPITKGD